MEQEAVALNEASVTWCHSHAESEKLCKRTYQQNKQTHSDRYRKTYGYQEGRGREMNGEMRTDMYALWSDI